MADKTEATTLKSFDPRTDAMQALMAKYGITPADMTAPKPHVTAKVNLDQICTETTPIYDPETGTNLGAESHTGPLMYLNTRRTSADENPNFKTRYDNYIGFFVYTFGHPTKGEVVCTHGIPATGQTELSDFISTLNPGNFLQIAMFRTSGGNRLFKAVPVQA